MNTYVELEAYFHAFVYSALDAEESYASRLGRFFSRGNNPRFHLGRRKDDFVCRKDCDLFTRILRECTALYLSWSLVTLVTDC